jgi:signal transduction histidine kinase
MGLARTRKLAIQLGGKVGFESRPGHGARFWLSVPLRRPEASDSM